LEGSPSRTKSPLLLTSKALTLVNVGAAKESWGRIEIENRFLFFCRRFFIIYSPQQDAKENIAA